MYLKTFLKTYLYGCFISESMKEKILVITSTFPRWVGDTTPRFVYDLSNKLADIYKIIILAPHHYNAAKRENMGKLEIRRFAYFKPERMDNAKI